MTVEFCQAAQNNRRPIADCLKSQLAGCKQVWEFGAGTGQHAEFFASELPWLTWHPSDLAERQQSMQARFDVAGLRSRLQAQVFELGTDQLTASHYDAIFTANTLHIVAWPLVEEMFRQASRGLRCNGRFCIYGPFKEHGHHNSQGNEQFDTMLRQQGYGGIVELDELISLARKFGLEFVSQLAMPANNRILVFVNKKDG